MDTVVRMTDEREHFLPIRRVDLERRLLAEAGDDERQPLSEFTAILSATLHDAYHSQLERLKDLYEPINPDRDTIAIAGDTPVQEPLLISELQDLLTSANYRRLATDELNRAMKEESLFQVRLHTRLDDFAQLLIFHRGKRNRNEVVHRRFRKPKLVSVDYYSRVAIYVRAQDQAWFDGQRRRPPAFKPGTAMLKLFQNVPCADIEMLMPNAEVRMRLKDQLILGIPALVGGIVLLVTKLLAPMILIGGLILFWLGMRNEDVELDAKKLVVLGIALATLAGFVWRQMGAFKNRKLRFMKELADSLYFKSLDNNAGVFHRLLDEAEEEDAKETLLAYIFLHRAGQPLTEAQLDERIEAWFKTTLTFEVDFEVGDALAKLERYRLATRQEEQWTAVPLAEAKRILDERWDNKFSFAKS